MICGLFSALVVLHMQLSPVLRLIEYFYVPIKMGLPLQVWDNPKGSVSYREQRCPTWKENYVVSREEGKSSSDKRDANTHRHRVKLDFNILLRGQEPVPKE